jgi:hypothetical protein
MDGGKPSAKTIAKPTKGTFHQRSTFVLSPHARMVRDGALGPKYPHLCPTDDDTTGLVILCKIAHTCTKSVGPAWREPGNLLDEPTKVSDLDQLFFCALSDHDV